MPEEVQEAANREMQSMHITARRGSRLAKAIAAAKPFTIMIDGKVYRVTASPVAEAGTRTPETRDIDGRPVVG